MIYTALIGISLSEYYYSHTKIPKYITSHEQKLWAEFCAYSADLSSAFLSFSFTRIAAQIFSGVRVCRIEREGRTLAFLPYQFNHPTHRLLGLGQRVGGNLNDCFGLIAAAECVLSPRRLLRLAGLNALLFTHLDQGQSRFGLTGSQPQIGLRIDLSAGSAVYWDALKRNDKRFVADSERRERKLIETHGALRLTFHQPNPEAELTRLIAAKRAQYARTGAPDCLADDKARHFLHLLAASDDPLCRGVMTTLHAGETWVASHFGLMHGGTLHFWFPAYNPDLHAFSPGRVLLTALIKQADGLGLRCIDRGTGDSQAKRDFANAEHIFTRGLWSRRTVPAAMIHAGLSLQWRLARTGK